VLDGKVPVCVNAKYNAAYSRIAKKEWWSVKASGGPVIEQATHFADILRFLAGEVDLKSVQALNVPASSAIVSSLVEMPAAPGGEHTIPAEDRIPRCTSAIFKFQSGAIGTLTHALLLHDQRYFTEVDIWADGIRIMIQVY
jgi:predicted dehydrogenase